jgi:hypothetical protein
MLLPIGVRCGPRVSISLRSQFARFDDMRHASTYQR